MNGANGMLYYIVRKQVEDRKIFNKLVLGYKIHVRSSFIKISRTEFKRNLDLKAIITTKE